MTDLVAFIAARLAEDERTALAATRNVWTVDSWTNDNGVEFLVIADHDAGAPAFALKSEQDAAHIARHDPARVLRQVAAQRAILAAHPRANEPGEPPHCETCRYTADTGDPEPFPEAGYPCPTVRLLAAPFADHPDYRT